MKFASVYQPAKIYPSFSGSGIAKESKEPIPSVTYVPWLSPATTVTLTPTFILYVSLAITACKLSISTKSIFIVYVPGTGNVAFIGVLFI